MDTIQISGKCPSRGGNNFLRLLFLLSPASSGIQSHPPISSRCQSRRFLPARAWFVRLRREPPHRNNPGKVWGHRSAMGHPTTRSRQRMAQLLCEPEAVFGHRNHAIDPDHRDFCFQRRLQSSLSLVRNVQSNNRTRCPACSSAAAI